MKIYVCTHRAFEPPGNPMYVPIHVGSAAGEDFGYLRDDSGDNISELNPYFSELTGLYWIWKNDHESDIVGTAHYRRYLLDDFKNPYTEGAILKLLEQYDIVTTKLLELDYPYYDAFDGKHHKKDLDVLENVIEEKRPEYLELYRKIIHGKRTYFGNMFVMKKELYDMYMEFLFPVLFEARERIDMTGYNGYQKRLFGFMSEVLLYVWTSYNHLKVKESLVGMIGQKAETTQIKQQLSKYLRTGDIQGAKACFMDIYSRRPDILMEASDIFHEGRLSMQAISTLEWELDKYGLTRLDMTGDNDYKDIDNLLDFYRKLNEFVRKNPEITTVVDAGTQDEFIINEAVNDIELMVARKVILSNQ